MQTVSSHSSKRELLKRLSSFVKWPPCESVSPVVLANAGFRYTGDGDRVSCAVCLIQLEGWGSNRFLHPRKEHVARSPNCSLALACSQADTDQLPAAALSVTNHDQVRDKSASSSDGQQSLKPNPAVARAESLASEQGPSAQATGLSDAGIDRNNPDFVRLRIERIRLSTYRDWPNEAHPKPRELAADGWFYTGQSDRVCCAFCRGILHHWSIDDRPVAEHRKHFPNCPFVKGRDVGNVPLPNHAAAEDSPVGEPAGHKAQLGSRQVPDNAPPKMSENTAAPTTRFPEASRVSSEKGAGINSQQQHQTSAPAELGSGGDDEADLEQRLLAEHQQLVAARTCKVCMENEVNTVFLPCGHLVACHTCSPRLKDCPVCRTYIRGTVKTFLS